MRADDYPQTAESIAHAKAAAAQERAAITAATGIRITTEGQIVRDPVLVPCGVQGCRFVASAITDARALRGWAAHRIRSHATEKGSR